MQYTAASFAQPVLDPFAGLLSARVQRSAVTGEFPQSATEDSQLCDPGEAAVQWTLAALVAPLSRVRVLQRGPVQLYLLYVLLTLLVLLVWQVDREWRADGDDCRRCSSSGCRRCCSASSAA